MDLFRIKLNFGYQSYGGVESVIGNILFIVAKLVPILIGLAVVFFLWGVMKYGLSQKEEERESAKGIIINGIIILFVMVSFWGLVNVIANTLDLAGPQGNTLQENPINTKSLIR